MSLFKSDNERIPEIPPAPNLRRFPKIDLEDKTIPELPTLPSKNSINEKFNQQMVKSAINDNFEDNYDYENQEDDFDEINKIKEKFTNLELTPQREYNLPQQSQQNTPLPEKNTVFVKIDKFKSLQQTLAEMQEKIKELSKQVQNLKQVKTKELDEINLWDDQMRKMNQKLSKIDSDMFGEV
ncbi:MAG: hypothetical protein PHX15_02220 [Candidatus Nanoarchaeia archaeon]|jgi:vacuolar-type H+-ATPase subunit I/STV1|nr:hypothetical protein [Candidatus Nanoarchaeia archaeon]MDD3993990.1 hypothetical protein [Candidatus Nanoarchaeia archaeon]MDD4563359.1 hypothetical protein [Candidatus Nanoarchaeia archaeon]